MMSPRPGHGGYNRGLRFRPPTLSTGMAISEKNSAAILARCGRHCCICRRYRPLHLQVHHIIEQADGGTDDEDNLIPACISCHADVHTQTLLTRRFTPAELKLHRDNVYRLVAEGRLPAGRDDDDALATLSAAIIGALRLLPGARQGTRPPLPADAVEILLAAVAENAPILVVRYDGGVAVQAGGKSFGEAFNLRSSARYMHAIKALAAAGLVEGTSETLFVTHEGCLLADDILAAGSQANPATPSNQGK